MKCLFGIDIGGTTVKIGYLDLNGNILEKWEIRTDKSNNGENILPDIAKSVLDYIAMHHIDYDDILGIGFGVPGPVANNIVVECVNLGWKEKDVRAEFLALLPFKTNITASNDANVAAYGEMAKSENKIKSAIMITLGTGVGGGVISNGQLLDGNNGAAGELGHIHVDDKHNYKCNCGLTGCLETLASATGTVRLAKEYLKDYPNSILNGQEIDAKAVFIAAEKGDELGLKVVDEVGYYLGLACANIAAIMDPECFFIGGGMSKSGQFLIDAINKHYKKLAFHACRNTKFYIAKLGNDSGMVGAALLAKK